MEKFHIILFTNSVRNIQNTQKQYRTIGNNNELFFLILLSFIVLSEQLRTNENDYFNPAKALFIGSIPIAASSKFKPFTILQISRRVYFRVYLLFTRLINHQTGYLTSDISPESEIANEFP